MKKLLTLLFFAITTPIFSVTNYDLDDVEEFLREKMGIDTLRSLRKERKNFKYDDILANTLKPEGFMGVKLDPSSIIEDKKLITMLFDNEALQNGDFSKTFLACIKYYPQEMLNYIRENQAILPNHLSSPKELVNKLGIKELINTAAFCRISHIIIATDVIIQFYIDFMTCTSESIARNEHHKPDEDFRDFLRAFDLLLGQKLAANNIKKLKSFFERRIFTNITDKIAGQRGSAFYCLLAAHGLISDLRGYEKAKVLHEENASNYPIVYDAAVDTWDTALDLKYPEYKHHIISFYKPRDNDRMIPQIDNILAYYDYVCGKTTLTFPENYDTLIKQAMNASRPFLDNLDPDLFDSAVEIIDFRNGVIKVDPQLKRPALFYHGASKLTREILTVNTFVVAHPKLHNSFYSHYLSNGITPEKEVAQSTAYLLYKYLLELLNKFDEYVGYSPQEEIFEFTPFEKIMKESQKIFNLILDKEVDYKLPYLPNKKLISKALLAKMMKICLHKPNTTYDEFVKSINKLVDQTVKNFCLPHKDIELAKTEAEQFFDAHKNDSFAKTSRLLNASLEASQKLQSNLLKMQKHHEKSIQRRYQTSKN